MLERMAQRVLRRIAAETSSGGDDDERVQTEGEERGAHLGRVTYFPKRQREVEDQ